VYPCQLGFCAIWNELSNKGGSRRKRGAGSLTWLAATIKKWRLARRGL